MCISVSGPQGPVVPAGPHQLPDLGRKKMCSGFMPHFFHSPALSSSRGQSSSPAKQVMAMSFTGMPRYSGEVRNSNDQGIICSLK